MCLILHVPTLCTCPDSYVVCLAKLGRDLPLKLNVKIQF